MSFASSLGSFTADSSTTAEGRVCRLRRPTASSRSQNTETRELPSLTFRAESTLQVRRISSAIGQTSRVRSWRYFECFDLPKGRYWRSRSLVSFASSAPNAVVGPAWLRSRALRSRHTSENPRSTLSAQGVCTASNANAFRTFKAVTSGPTPSTSATLPTCSDTVTRSASLLGPTPGSNVSVCG